MGEVDGLEKRERKMMMMITMRTQDAACSSQKTTGAVFV